MGPDQIHGVVRWISILCATKPPNLTLFGNTIIISQIAIEKNLKKFLSPHLKKTGLKKSAVKGWGPPFPDLPYFRENMAKSAEIDFNAEK